MIRPLLLALAVAAAPLAAVAQTAQQTPTCPITAAHLAGGETLDGARAAVAGGRLTILAMGSSSIEGVGASRPELSFVPLLQAGLERRLPAVDVTVINRGIGGETAKETADRLRAQVAEHRPDLVIWQLGTNDVLRDRSLDDFFADFRRGERILDAAGVDVLLIDPQRLPEDTTKPEFKGRNPALGETARLIELEGGRVGYARLHRFAAMHDWTGVQRGGVGPDDLHLNDAGYWCWAELTAEGLAAALR
jgi:acyl-CoA thioesterase-1